MYYRIVLTQMKLLVCFFSEKNHYRRYFGALLKIEGNSYSSQYVSECMVQKDLL